MLVRAIDQKVLDLGTGIGIGISIGMGIGTLDWHLLNSYIPWPPRWIRCLLFVAESRASEING